MADINSFLCYRSYIEAANLLPAEQRWSFLEAVAIYALDNVEPEFTDYGMKLAFTLMKANIDSCNKRYISCVENGKKGGRPPSKNIKNEGEKKPTKNPAKPSHNLNKDDNDNVNDNYQTYATSAGALSAPPPTQAERPKGEEQFEMHGKRYEYYTANDGERRVRQIE